VETAAPHSGLGRIRVALMQSSNGWAECREKKIGIEPTGRFFFLDDPFNRAFPVTPVGEQVERCDPEVVGPREGLFLA
jgi:hypothetical protein